MPGRAQAEYILFVRERDPARETWDGRRAGPAGAARDYGADDAFPIADIDEILPGLLENRARVFYTMGAYADFDQRVVGWVNGLRATQARNGRHPPQEFVALDHVLHDMRLYKSRAELELMRRAAQIAAQAHVRAMRFCRPGRTEYEVMAELLHEFRRSQRRHRPITRSWAAAPNSCILHYRENNQPLARRRSAAGRCRLRIRVLRLGHHPHLSGQRTLHPRAARGLRGGAGGESCRHRAGAPGQSLERAARGRGARHHAGAGASSGCCKGRLPNSIESGAYRRFFMHRTGHWLGMDVHDVGDYKVGDEWRVLEPGHGADHRARHLHCRPVHVACRSASATSAYASRTTWS